MGDYGYNSLQNTNCTPVQLPDTANSENEANQKQYHTLLPPLQTPSGSSNNNCQILSHCINNTANINNNCVGENSFTHLPTPSGSSNQQNFSIINTAYNNNYSVDRTSLNPLNSDESSIIQKQDSRLLKLLKQHPHGLNVLNYYNLNKTLNKSTRNLLGRLVLYKEHEGKPTVECLPASREVEGTYYTPHSGASGGAAVQCARGLLLACNSYMRSQHLKKQKTAKPTIFPRIALEEPTNVISESYQFIQKYIEPWESVVYHWKNSYVERQKEAELIKSSIGDYFKKFPCLKQTKGYALLEHDFNLKFPGKKDAFNENWPAVRKQLIYLFNGPRKPVEPELQALALGLPFLKEDSLDLAIFLLLSAAFPKPKFITNKTDVSSSKSKKKIKRDKSENIKGWNPSKPEARGGFIFNVKAANNVLTSLSQLQNTLATYKLPLQPRPVIVGCVENIISSHIYINEILYDLESSVRSVEAAFKTYYALNAQYPPEAKSAWLFIEQAVFKLDIQQEQPIPMSVTTLFLEMSFICKCSKVFSIDVAFSKHIIYEHGLDDPMQSYQCLGSCTRKYDCIKSFRKHLRNIHFYQPRHHKPSSKKQINKKSIVEEFQDYDHEADENNTTESDKNNDGNEEFFFNFNLNDQNLVYIDKSIYKNYMKKNYEICEKLDELFQPNLTEFNIKQDAYDLTSKWYANKNISRKEIQFIINDVSTFYQRSLDSIADKTISILIDNNVSDSVSSDVINLFSQINKPFDDLSSEYLRFKQYKEQGTLIQPECILLGSIPSTKTVNGVTKICSQEVFTQFIPMRKVLKAFFELPTILERTLLYMDLVKSDTDTISNFTQGTLWSKILSQYHADDVVLPLFLYFDDFETNNCLGSHAGDGGKIGAVYISLPCLPPELYSKLDNIFLFQYFTSLHRQIFGNQRIFQKIIDELNYLAIQGIEVEVDNEKKRIFFCLGLVLGDNLGLNSILGFNESFNSSYWCRCCIMDKKCSFTATTELPDLIRTKESYDSIIESLDEPKKENFGVKEKCVWNEVKHFHVAVNFSVDVMHDLLEGICKYELAEILNYYIYVKKVIDEEILNNRIDAFSFNRSERKNKPPEIIPSNIKKLHLKLSASETLCFMRHFGLFIGDLIPEDDEFWSLYLSLNEILNILQAKSFHYKCPDLLRTLIADHLGLYQRVIKKKSKTKTPSFTPLCACNGIGWPGYTFFFDEGRKFSQKCKNSCSINFFEKKYMSYTSNKKSVNATP
ncbi:unnamed protein product [Brassicogethes aeneus]|uniref:C2H2-type domain-containing protein n=1 Tax=Brassicogethes aeneus TaxID=1431903 RepID=A0A9P0AU22_BRAAE|nr:unnamed protein product [Brassicogethes aeneus]